MRITFPAAPRCFVLLALLKGLAVTVPAQTTITYNNGDSSNTNRTTTAGNALTLQVSTGTATESGAINGTGSLTKTGAGTLVYNGNPTYSGGTIIQAGTLSFGNAFGIVLQNNFPVQIATGATLDYQDNGVILENLSGTGSITSSTGGNAVIVSHTTTYSLSASIIGLANFYMYGGGTVNVSSVNTYTGYTFMDSGTINLLPGSSIVGTSSVEFADTSNASLTVQHGATIGTSGMFSFGRDPGANGTLNIGAASGDTAQGAGIVDAPSIVGGSGTATLQFNTTGTSAAPTYFTRDGTAGGAAVELTGGLNVLNTAGYIVLTGNNTYTGGTTISGGTLQFYRDGTAGSVSGNITNNAALVFNYATSATFGGTITGNGTLSKLGAGYLTLTAANTYSGGTTLSGGGLILQGSGSLGTGPVTNHGELDVAGSTTLGNVTVTNQGQIYLMNSATAGTSTITNNNSAFFTAMNGATLGTAVITNNGTLLLDNTASAGSASIANNGTLRFFAQATATSATIVNGASSNVDIGTATNGISLGSLAGGGFLHLGNQTASVGALNTSTTFSGVIADAGATAGTGGALNKVGTGSLTLTGANTYTGGTTLSAGTLVTTSTGLGSGLVSLADANVALRLDASANRNLTNAITVLSGTGSASIGSINSTDFVTFGGNLSLSRPTTLFDSTGLRTTFSGVISGNVGTLTIAGGAGSRVTLEGTNTFTGNVSVANDTILQLTSTGHQILPTNARVDLNSSGILWLVNDSALGSLAGGTGALVQVADGVSTSATLTVGTNNASTTYAGSLNDLNGVLSLVKTGTGTLTLTNPNGSIYAFSGGTTVSGGTLLVNSPTGISSASGMPYSATSYGDVEVNAGGTLGGTGAIGGIVTLHAGSILAPGSNGGSLTLENGINIETGAIFNFRLGSTPNTLVVHNGTMAGPTGTGGITLNFTNAGGFSAGNYTLFDFTSGGASTADFDISDFTLGTTIPGYSYSLAFSSNTLQLTAVSAIPEPATYAALLGTGMLGFATWRRRQTKR